MTRFTFIVIDTDPATDRGSIFRVVAVSENWNSFGYRQVLLVAEDGRTAKALWNIGRGEKEPQVGQPCTLSNATRDGFHRLLGSPWSFELIESVPKRAPQPIVNMAWKGVAS
jgi:hypothetical protein